MQKNETGSVGASSLAQGNAALRDNNYEMAASHYARALLKTPDLAQHILPNLEMAAAKYRVGRAGVQKARVGVCGWELSHNAAGRAYTLATLYERFAEVEMVGSIFPRWGRDIWEPIRKTPIPKHVFVVEQEHRFLEQALELVARHPYDIVHLSKPRAPNIIFGLLYKLIWNAKVLMDIDDEELAFVNADASLTLDDYITRDGRNPELKDLPGKAWTRLAVGLATCFDGVTVSNAHLQSRYGGSIIPHARNEKSLVPSPAFSRQCRQKFNIPLNKQVVLFFGTPRNHKGLLHLASALAKLQRDDLLLVIVGDFQDPELKRSLLSIRGINYQFIGNQPFDSIPEVAAIGDFCVVVQHPDSAVSQFQMPAKLTDAFAMGLVVFVNDLPPLADCISNGACIVVDIDNLPSRLAPFLDDPDRRRVQKEVARQFFLKELSISVVSTQLQRYIDKIMSTNKPLNQNLENLLRSGVIPGYWMPQETVKNPSARADIAQTVDIIVPVFNALDDAKKCLDSLLLYRDGIDVRVIVVNDGSDETTTKWLREYCLTSTIIFLVEHDRNYGYTTAINTGLKESRASYVITQNSDTIVTNGWLKGLIRCINSAPDIGIVGPLSNAASWQNVPVLYNSDGTFKINKLPIGVTEHDMAKIVAKTSRHSYPRLPFVNGFCFMIKRSVIDAIGYMDVENFPVGYGEENDYCIRAANAGFQFAIADDVYVFHAKSKSFGHDKRKELSRRGTEALIRKHTASIFNSLVDKIKDTAPLDSVREEIKKELERSDVNSKAIDIRQMRILFLLPIKGSGGGVHSVVQEATEMRRLGLQVNIAVLSEHKNEYLDQYSDIHNAVDVFKSFDADNIQQLAKDYDIVIATYFRSIELLKRIVDALPNVLPAYYVQDYEPLFFSPDKLDWKIARDSYTLIPGALLFSKTHWIAEKVKQEHGLTVVKVEPSIDHNVYMPQCKFSKDRIHISAMIRPKTPRRGAERTMRVLSELEKANPGRLSFHLFGCSDKDPKFLQLPRDFEFKNYGELKRQEVANLLGQCDIFVDLSDYQAFGRTALEAMACGCTSVVPKNGGADEYAIDGVNSIIVDTLDESASVERINELLGNPHLLQKMQLEGLYTASKYSLNRAAVSEIKAFKEYADKNNISLDESKNISPKTVVEATAKLPLAILIISWDVGHNPLGRAYMLAEVVDRIAQNVILAGFQFERYGNDLWEPMRNGRIPVISLPGSNLPEFHEHLRIIAQRVRPDVVIACKPRLPSVELGLMIKEYCGCPLIIDIDDHELSFFKNATELSLSDIANMPKGCASKEIEPYSEIWTRLAESLCKTADQIIVSNIALHHKFGGIIVPHVRDEQKFDPTLYNCSKVRSRYGISETVKIILFFGTARAHKGIATLAQVVNRISNPNFKLLVVGTPVDLGFTEKLDAMAPGRIIYLPNQPIDAIPEILAMADIVCLPQDEDHPISQYQLPAKAIDAIAMGVPLLVSRTLPMSQLVNDQVAEFVNTTDLHLAIERLLSEPKQLAKNRNDVRNRFLMKYSYAFAADQMRNILQTCLASKRTIATQDSSQLIAASRRLLGLTPRFEPPARTHGVDIVLFWKQNDTGLYGRRHDMVIKYLSSRPDVRKVIVFDRPIPESKLLEYRHNISCVNQNRQIYVGAYQKFFGAQTTQRTSNNVLIYPDALSSIQKREAYVQYINQIFNHEDVDPARSIFWFYPKDFFASQLIRHFKPNKVVVDVVDDHRAWPGQSESEKQSLTNNYREILSLADMAFANCEPVRQSMQEFFPAIRMVPNGCDSNPPNEEPHNSVEFNAFRSWPGRTIGYIGNLEKKIDIVLLSKLAERFATCQIVLIGSTHTNPDILMLKRYANVRLIGVVPYQQAGAWVSRFDVGLVPHIKMELTKNMNPLKQFVYLSYNVPVVSTEVSNIEKNSELVHIAASHDDFIMAVAATLERGRPPRDISERYVAANNWEMRFSSHVDELINIFREINRDRSI
jgi:glycosyltransferase involved in cell wall biosynthesis